MTRHLPNWARIYRIGGEHIFGVYVVTCDTWHLAILFDWVQGIMLVSQGKVLSPGNEGSMALNVYASIFSPTLLYLCSYANFRAFLCGAILVHARHRETIDVLNGSPQPDLDCELGYCYTCGIWLLFRVEGGLHFLYFWIWTLDFEDFEKCNR